MATVAEILRVTPADHGRRMTLDEFYECEEEEGYRYELARGVLEVSEVPNDPHGLLIWCFACAVADYHRTHPGRIFRFGGAAEFRLWLPGMISGRNPDYSVVLQGTPKNPRGRRPPSLVVEVVSAGSEARQRDYVTKREEYLVFGVLEYWIIDPIARKVTVLARNGDVWAETVFVAGQSATGLALPGFAVAVADLWAALADAPDEDDEEMGDA